MRQTGIHHVAPLTPLKMQIGAAVRLETYRMSDEPDIPHTLLFI